MGEEMGASWHRVRAAQAAAEAFGGERPETAEIATGARRLLRVPPWLERMWKADPNRATPKRVTRAVGVISGLILLLNPPGSLQIGHGVAERVLAVAIFGLLFGGADWIVERWYRARRRREREHLLPPGS